MRKPTEDWTIFYSYISSDLLLTRTINSRRERSNQAEEYIARAPNRHEETPSRPELITSRADLFAIHALYLIGALWIQGKQLSIQQNVRHIPQSTRLDPKVLDLGALEEVDDVGPAIPKEVGHVGHEAAVLLVLAAVLAFVVLVLAVRHVHVIHVDADLLPHGLEIGSENNH